MRLTDVDFMRQPGQPATAWWLLAAGVMSLAGSLVLAHQWRAQRADASAQEQAVLDARQARRQSVAALPPTPAQRRWMQARPQLDRPWNAALDAVEAVTRDPVYLLAMNIEPATGTIRLEGEAAGFDQALAYVQALGMQPAIASATLESHADATGVSPANGPVVRFSAVAHWKLP